MDESGAGASSPLEHTLGEGHAILGSHRLSSVCAFDPNTEWDPDNLLRAFFDALADAGFFGQPAIPGSTLKGDERVDYLQVRKRAVQEPEEAGARIELYAVNKP